MALNISVEAMKDEITCGRGERVELAFDIHNQQDSPISLGIEPSGPGAKWVKMDEAHAELEFAADELKKIKLIVDVPEEAEPGSAAPANNFKLRVYNAHNRIQVVESGSVAIVVPAPKAPPIEPPPPGGDKRNWWPIIIAASIGGVVLIGGIVALILYLVFRTPALPDFTGMSAQEANAWLQEHDYGEPAITEDVTGSQEPGLIVRQDPPAGEKLADDAALNLVIEQLSVLVPDLRGMIFGAAETALTNAGLELGDRTTVSTGNFPGGAVIDQMPAANTLAIPGMAVSLTLEKELVTVPPLTGQTFSGAQNLLEQQGLSIAQGEVINAGGTPGSVAAQDPPSGSRVDRGTTVRVDLVAQRITVPNVVNQTLAEATRNVGRAQLMLAPVQNIYTGTREIGRIERQNPAAGSQVPVGSSVTLSVRAPRPTIPGPISEISRVLLDPRKTVITSIGIRGVASEDSGDGE